MKEYQLEIKQVLDYPRCRIYREFVQSLISDRNLRTSSSSHLFHYTVLCCYANFRTSYLRIDGASYIIRPGEWLCRISDLTAWFRVRFHHQALSILSALQQMRLITFSKLGQGHLVKYRITAWRKHNTVLDYNCPCQKETGFFFMPISAASKLIDVTRASEIDVLLDLWFSTIYKDKNVLGSELAPIVYYRNGTGNPLVSFSELAKRWGRSRSSVGRLLKKLSDQGYLSLVSFPGRNGSVIYLNNYLSTMFHIPDIAVQREDAAASLNITIRTPDAQPPADAVCTSAPICTPDFVFSVPKWHIDFLVGQVAQALEAQGLSCFKCPKSSIKLSPLSVDCQGTDTPLANATQTLHLEMELFCSEYDTSGRFSITISALNEASRDWRDQNGRKP